MLAYVGTFGVNASITRGSNTYGPYQYPEKLIPLFITNALDRLVADLGIAGDVVFVGGVPLEQTAVFYRAADAFVYPSFNESFGLPILEAMACGCPVVTSEVSAMPEIAGGAAVLADPQDPKSIAAAIVRACGPESQQLRESGLRRAGQFTWGGTAERTLDVYREVTARRRRKKQRR